MLKNIFLLFFLIFYQASLAQIDRLNVSSDFVNTNQCLTDISKLRSQAMSSGGEQLLSGCPFLSPCDDSNLRDDFLNISLLDTIFFKLRWNIIRNNLGITNFTGADLNAMMNSLNLNFEDAKIQFTVDTINYLDNDELYYINIPNQFENYDTEDSFIKETAGGDYNELINVYVIDNNFGNAYANWPWAFPPNGSDLSIRSGIVLFTNPNYLEENPNLIAHEMGHVFGLLHVFEGYFDCDDCHEYGDENGISVNGDMAGDFISDTNPSPIIPVCEEFSVNDPCTDIIYVDIPNENLMSYSDCREEFTSQQVARMRCMINEHLTNWTLTDVSVNTQQVSRPEIQLFPNPVNERLFVKGASNDPFIIYSLNGQKLKTGLTDNIIISDLTNSVYVLEIIFEEHPNQVHLFYVRE